MKQIQTTKTPPEIAKHSPQRTRRTQRKDKEKKPRIARILKKRKANIYHEEHDPASHKATP